MLKYLYGERKITASGHETTDTDPGIAASKEDYLWRLTSWARTIIKSSSSRTLIKFPKPARWSWSVFRNLKADRVFPQGCLRSCRKATLRLTLKSRSTQRICCGENLYMRLAALSIVLVLATNAFGQQKPESIPGDTGSDLLWKNLETRVRKIADRFDGVMGVTILDLTDGRMYFG